MNISTSGDHRDVRQSQSQSGGEEDGTAELNDIFQEPAGFYETKNTSPTFQQFTLSLVAQQDELREVTFHVRLVGQSPLWGHLLFPAGRYLSEYLSKYAATLLRGKAILELGAGSGLPGLICAYCEADAVVITDFPDAELLENLRYNVEHCKALSEQCQARVKVVGHIWGSDTDSLLDQIANIKGDDKAEEKKRRLFDTLILADLVFNHSEHGKLLSTVRHCLAYTRDARALVFFTPHRPWLYEADLRFFDLATSSPSSSSPPRKALGVRKIVEDEQEKWTMFAEDEARDRAEHPDDARLRRTVFGYELFWRDLQ